MRHDEIPLRPARGRAAAHDCLSQPVQRRTTRYFHPRPVLHGRAHGRRATYNDGCRCDDCTDADTLYQRQRRQS